jgi:hypothetical protein
MNDITQSHYFQSILVDASQYRTLYQLYRADPDIGPATAALLRECFKSYRNDAKTLRRMAVTR